ncbi:MAG: hypothetical protein R3B84_19715 [Zavarzinella sp.]
MIDACPHCGVKLPGFRDVVCPECNEDVTVRPIQKQQSVPQKQSRDTSNDLASGLWYATEKHLFAWWKIGWYVDRGAIGPTSKGICFFGGKGPQTFINPDLQIVGPIISWQTIVSLAVSIPLTMLMAGMGAFKTLSLDDPVLYIFLIVISIFVIANMPMYWVRIDYRDEYSQSGRAYFTAGSFLGRWSGGVNQLDIAIRTYLDQKEQRTAKKS